MIDHPSYKNTRSTQQEVHRAIDESKAQSVRVHLPHSEGAAEILSEECEGSDGDEYWGFDIDGNGWRVHLDRREG